MDFGATLKKHRKNKNLTLSSLADLSELSVSYLSKLENNATTPTLANMQKLCEALQISMVELLEERPAKLPRFIKSGLPSEQQPEIFATRSGVHYHMLFDKTPQAKIISMTIEEDNFKEELSWGHHYDEFGVIIEGELEMTINDEVFHMSPGDMIFIGAHEIHKYRKVGKGKCTSFWFYV